MSPLNLKAREISAALRDLLASNPNPYGLDTDDPATVKAACEKTLDTEPPKTGRYHSPFWALQESVHVPLDPQTFNARANGELDPDPDLVPDEEYFMDVSAADDYGPETEEDRALHARAVQRAGWKPKTHGPHQWGALGYCTVCGLVKSEVERSEAEPNRERAVPDSSAGSVATAHPAQNAPPTPPAAPRSHDQGQLTTDTVQATEALKWAAPSLGPEMGSGAPPTWSALPPDEQDAIEPLARLLHARRQLWEELSVLKARHGDGGTWTTRRHNLRAALAERFKQEAVSTGSKWTETGVERQAEADPQYLAFVEAGEVERIRMYVLENEVTSLTDRRRRGDGLIYAVGGEARGPNG